MRKSSIHEKQSGKVYVKKDISLYNCKLLTDKTQQLSFVVICFVVVMQSFIMNSHEVIIYIHRGCFAGTGAIVRLPQCQWSRPDGYGKISQCITAAGHGGAGAVYMVLGICCIFVSIYIYMCVCVCVWIMVFEWYWLQCYIAISWQMTTLSSAQSYCGTPYNLPILANYAESKLRYKFHLFLLCCMYYIG